MLKEEKTERAARITLPNGKYYYTNIGCGKTDFAKKKKWPMETVYFSGAAMQYNININAHLGLSIKIDGVNVKEMLEKIATEEEIDFYFDPLYQKNKKRMKFTYKGKLLNL